MDQHVSPIGRPPTPEQREKIKLGRMNATPKRAYSEAIRDHCIECSGHNPGMLDCENKACLLYPVNTRGKRRKTTKTTIRKVIVSECRYCLGTHTPSGCTSPSCKVYPYGAGRATKKVALCNTEV